MNSTVNLERIAEAVGDTRDAIERGRNGRLGFLELLADLEAARKLANTDPRAAAEAYESVRDRFEDAGNTAFALEAALGAATMFNRTGTPAKAQLNLGFLAEGITPVTCRVKLILILLQMGGALEGTAQWAEAAETYSEALDLACATGDIGCAAQVSMVLAAALAEWGRPAQAEAVLATIALTDDPAMPTAQQTQALMRLVKLRKQNGDPEGAASALSLALRLAGSSGDLDELTQKRIEAAERRLESAL